MATEVPFKEESDDNKLEALKLEHFFFPLVLWLADLGSQLYLHKRDLHQARPAGAEGKEEA